MCWTAYCLIYRAITPILLGYHPLGFIRRTRYYAPGWTLWGAITAQLTRYCFPKATGREYEEVGQFVAENLPTSYAYILVDGEPARPGFEGGQLRYGKLFAAEFEARFITSLGQTAISPQSLTAFNRSLYETEVLSAYDLRDGEPIRWQFTLYIRQPWQTTDSRLKELTAADVLAAIEKLTLGGDRRYGLGLVKREGEPKPQETRGREWPEAGDGDSEVRVLRAHVPIAHLSGKVVRGRVEAIPWRWWKNAAGQSVWGPGQLRKVQVFYIPGSQVQVLTWRPVVGPRGIWLTEKSDASPASP